MFVIWSVIGALTVARAQFGSQAAVRETLSGLLACTSWFFLGGTDPDRVPHRTEVSAGNCGLAAERCFLALISVPFCLAASPLMMGMYAAIVWALGAPDSFSGTGRFWPGAFPSAEGLFWCSIGGGYFFRTLFQLHEQEHRASQLALEKSRLEASLNQAQLEILRARLNPHFLFNSLQNISVLTKQDPQTASRMLAVLGVSCAPCCDATCDPKARCREEMELTQSYVALEQMRFGDRLRVTFEIAGDVQRPIIPSFLMQPLLENAIVHGLRGARKTGVIEVRAVPQNDQLVITVLDNGMGPPADANGLKIGLGLGSTCERLARMYPERHSFSIRKPPEGGAEVRIAIPLRFGGGRGSCLGE
jgi:hypothetical protein